MTLCKNFPNCKFGNQCKYEHMNVCSECKRQYVGDKCLRCSKSKKNFECYSCKMNYLSSKKCLNCKTCKKCQKYVLIENTECSFCKSKEFYCNHCNLTYQGEKCLKCKKCIGCYNHYSFINNKCPGCHDPKKTCPRCSNRLWKDNCYDCFYPKGEYNPFKPGYNENDEEQEEYDIEFSYFHQYNPSSPNYVTSNKII